MTARWLYVGAFVVVLASIVVSETIESTRAQACAERVSACAARTELTRMEHEACASVRGVCS